MCNMCEWLAGISEGHGTLGAQGIAKAKIVEELGAGEAVTVSFQDLRVALNGQLKAFINGLSGYEISANATHGAVHCSVEDPDPESRYTFTKSQMLNLLRFKGSPCDVLTDELWASLKASWPLEA